MARAFPKQRATVRSQVSYQVTHWRRDAAPDNALSRESLFGQRTIRFEYELDGFLQVFVALIECRAL